MFQEFLKNIKNDLKEQEILDEIVNMDFFNEVLHKLKPGGNMSQSEKDSITRMLATPDARPYDFDRTLEAWLLRISLWGRLTIRRRDPEDNVNKILGNQEFLAYMDNQDITAERGLWKVDELDINKIRFRRTFWSYLGKEVTEEVVVEIDLRPDLKDALRKARGKLGFWR